ncbi:unnamed protein product [Musa textilis]
MNDNFYSLWHLLVSLGFAYSWSWRYGFRVVITLFNEKLAVLNSDEALMHDYFRCLHLRNAVITKRSKSLMKETYISSEEISTMWRKDRDFMCEQDAYKVEFKMWL